MPEPFYLTTPIYYVNARPHIGHAYTTIVADVLARRARAQGRPTYFLTGTDEHGQKIERSAAAAGIPPQQFADQVSKSFSDLWTRMGITHDQFIRTTGEAHKRGVQQLFATLQAADKIYLSSYTGQYCVSEEMFVEGPPGTIGPDGRPTETVTEENYFFRLSDYQLPLLNLIESGELAIEPESRKNEVLSFLRGPSTNLGAPHLASEMWDGDPQIPVTAAGTPYTPGALRDLSISRSSFTWGIPVPGDEKHVIYVWLDALANYITALGYGSTDESLFQKFWPANLHIVGKEIIRFHCVYWPAFLLAANLPLPKKVVAHGWLLFDDSKMSKSKGNIVRTETILSAFGTLCPPPPPPVRHLREPEVGIEQSSTALPSPATEVISTEAQSAQWRDPRISLEAPPLSPSPGAPGLAPETWDGAASPARAPFTPEPHPGVSGSSTASHQTPATVASLSAKASAAPPTFPASLKGTALAVPHTGHQQAASAAEVPLSTTSLQPSDHDRDLFAADVLRYFLLREIPFGQDGSFTFEALVTRYNADLANGYGNLVSRVTKLVSGSLNGSVPTPEEDVEKLPEHAYNFLFGPHAGPMKSARRNEDGSFAMTVPRGPMEKCFGHLMLDCVFSTALENLWWAISGTDEYLTRNAPWKLLKGTAVEKLRAAEVLYTAAESIRIITALLHPILPHATASVWRQLGLGEIESAAKNGELTNLQWGGLKPGTKLGPLSPIFPRADKSLIQKMTDMENPIKDLTTITANNDATHPNTNDLPETPIADEVATKKPLSKLVDETSGHTAITNPTGFDPAAGPRTSNLAEPAPGAQVAGSNAATTERPGTPPHTEAASGIFAAQSETPQITIDDFAKVELRVAQIIVAERIPKADKLLRLEVDLGHEKRQILSGIAEWYTPEELLGRRIVVITNLAPRKMRGLESHGMLLAASTEGGKPHLATFADADSLPLGSRLK